MKKCRSVIVLFLLLSGFTVGAQTRNSLVLGKEHLILMLDLNSSKPQLDTILLKAGVKTINTAAILHNDFTSLTNDGWKLAKREKNTVIFNRALKDLDVNPQNQPVLITTNIAPDHGINPGVPGYPDEETFGINKFMKLTVYDLPSGLTRFYLPGFLKAKRVLLSGSFNNWSTLKGTMLKTDSGWVTDARLAPGVYEYKYIIDGRWQRDRDNLQQHADGFNDVNSVYYKYNHTFTLKGYANAKKVMLAGSFNNWDAGNISLQKTGNGWQTRFYLHDGTHTYRFWVDGKWVTDPANPITVKDADGHTNSVLNLGETVTFKLNGHTEAKKVYLAGSFNNWKPGEILLKKTATGWAIPIIVPPGNYGYKFIVDDNWITDPVNPRHITEGGISNSFISIKPNYTFRLAGYGNAKSVHIAGNFNDWDPDGLVMDHTGNEWTIKMHLKQGKYRYKFLADGKWLLDPANKLYEQNEQHTSNSFIWIE
ncbi:hypothetical protein [Mucilaginibacter flavus]|uniref:hypothetical protein n=1 Tax=Mucilaginibacter flavus TaxID=931504 RepID=UPI0025B293D1|nr:hypothetical protein [Mucilaginibacter flavus]MDN3579724.1 hypothetical protein [Mucilaginibacter flavus]